VNKFLSSRLPSRAEVFPVFSILAFLVYSWALYRLFWYLPSWLEYMSIPGVLIIAAYTLAFALFESLVMFGLLLLFCLAFPERFFRRCFVAQASLLALSWGAGAVLIQRQVSFIYRLENWQVGALLLAALAASVSIVLLGAWVFRRFDRLRRLVEDISERMTIFAMLYIPLGLIGVIVVLVRNLF
jgi:hypothetical protein